MVKYSSMIILLFFFSLPNFILSEEEYDLEYKFVFAMCRHGARSPYNNLTDDYVDIFGEKWDGIKELTGVGLRQHFLIGIRNRKRYITDSQFLESTFNPKEIQIFSTDSNRTILSANAQMQGMYPEGTSPILNSSQQEWANPPNKEEYYKEEKEALQDNALPNRMNVVPVHTFYSGDHYIQLQDAKNCEGMKINYEKKMNSKIVNDHLKYMVDEYGELLSNITILRKDALIDHKIAYSVLDAYIANYYEGRDLSKFGEKWEQLLNDSYKFFDYELYGATQDDIDASPYAMSPIFESIIKWMEERKDKKKEEFGYESPKFVLYSAHDSTLAAFESFIKLVFGKESQYPYLASNLNLELVLSTGKESKKSTLVVNYYFNDKYIFTQSFEDFKKKVNAHIKTKKEIYEFCGIKEEEKEIVVEEGEKHFKIATIVFGSLFGVLAIGNILTFLLLRK